MCICLHHLGDYEMSNEELEAEFKRRQAARSRAIGLILAGLAVLFYVITYFKFPLPK